MALVEFETRKELDRASWSSGFEDLWKESWCFRLCLWGGHIYPLLDMMTIPVSLRIHAIQDFHHVTISWSDVISSSGANEADTPLGFQPDRTRGWLGLCWFAFNKAGVAWKPSVCERLVFHLFGNGYIRKVRCPFTGQIFDFVCHGAMLRRRFKRQMDVVSHWRGIEASFCILFSLSAFIFSFRLSSFSR